MKRILILAFLAVGFSSCTNYLEVKTYGKAIPTTSEEFSALLHSHLNKVDYGEATPLLENASDLVDMDLITDDFNVALTLPEGMSLKKYMGDILNDKQQRYERLYAVIRDANIIINNMPSTTSPLERNVVGTAYALRAIANYYLLREYCEPFTSDDQLGIVIIKDFDMEERAVRSTYGASKAMIESDFQSALSFDVKDNIYRYTTDVVKAYQARYYFWTQQWAKAVPVAQQLVENHPLVSGKAYTDMIQSKNVALGDVLLKSYLFVAGQEASYASNTRIAKSRPVSKEFIALFAEKEKDIRYALSFDAKRINQKALNGKVRIAEMQLILAESYAHLGQQDLALTAINDLRAKRITGYTPYTLGTLPVVDATALVKVDAEDKPLTPLMQLILNERRKELYLEGDRFFELKRNGRPEFWAANNGLKYVTEKFMYTFPLPRIDVEVVSGLIQNDGYKF